MNDTPARIGLTLTPHQKAHLANRLMLQGTLGASPAAIAAHRRSIERNLNGIPGDVLFALDALRLLADQGNIVAKDLFDSEVERMGLNSTGPTSYFGANG